MNRLDGKIALVTGAGRGLGHGIARRLAGEGATVIAVSRTQSELDELSGVVNGNGGTISTYSADLARRADTDSLIDHISSEFGGVDILINNAAVLRMMSFIDLSEDDFNKTISINLTAPTRLIRGFLPYMRKKQQGAIVNVTSGAGIRGTALETDYCASKFGIEGFSYSLALELASENISVNLVTPGYSIKPTSITAAEFAAWAPEDQAKYRDPIDMTDAFVFLGTQFPKDSGITGQRFNAFELSERVRKEGWGWNSNT